MASTKMLAKGAMVGRDPPLAECIIFRSHTLTCASRPVVRAWRSKCEQTRVWEKRQGGNHRDDRGRGNDRDDREKSVLTSHTRVSRYLHKKTCAL